VIRFTAGDAVQTSFGKGVIREVRNNHRLLVDVQGRALVVSDADVTALETNPPPVRTRAVDRVPTRESRGGSIEIDLHGLTVEEALARVEIALNEALLADVDVVRLIHGKSGGRIRSALHRYLRGLHAVRSFRVDPRNEGVTLVTL
jgi:DNA mismatch repair protein MutS2